MKIKVSESTGPVLDWMVAKAAGRLEQRVVPDPRPGCSAIDIGVAGSKVMVFDHTRIDYVPFTPSTDWSQGGPIIEREKIAVDYDHDVWNAAMYGRPWYIGGPTPLIAAMRCYAASKLGEEVDVPDELTQT